MLIAYLIPGSYKYSKRVRLIVDKSKAKPDGIMVRNRFTPPLSRWSRRVKTRNQLNAISVMQKILHPTRDLQNIITLRRDLWYFLGVGKFKQNFYATNKFSSVKNKLRLL